MFFIANHSLKLVSLRRKRGESSLCHTLAVAFCCLLNSNPKIWAWRDPTNHLAYSLYFMVAEIRTPRCELTFSKSTLLAGGSKGGFVISPGLRSRACRTAYKSPTPASFSYWWWYALKFSLLLWEKRSEVGGGGELDGYCLSVFQKSLRVHEHFKHNNYTSSRRKPPQINIKH